MSQQKHIFTRTCVVCRKKRQHDELLRLVKTPEGQIMFDSTGRMDGRGAYICADADHWGGGIDRDRLNNALKATIDDSTLRSLNEAMDLPNKE
jgi:predicted RNA-binding protein YlxR (DUF448 family)